MTIFITISRGIIARNLLQNRFYELVKGHFSKVVLITTAADDRRFQEEFAGPNVEIIPAPEERVTFLGNLFERLNRYVIFNASTVGFGLYWYAVPPSLPRWILKRLLFVPTRLIFEPLSKVPAVRKSLQWIDTAFLERRSVARYRELIRAYKPDIVFVTNILEESAVLKAARRERVRSVGMAKTWDNISKRYFRARADAVAVWGSFSRDELQQMHDYKEGEIRVVGMPQLDSYVDPDFVESREDFCRRMGLDPKKKIVVLGSEGKIMPSDSDIAGIIADAIDAHELAECQLFIRPHFAHTNDARKFDALLRRSGVVVDSHNNPSEGFGDHWDYSRDQMRHFLSILRHADVLINAASTLTLDAAAAGTPTLLYMFDGHTKQPLYKSSARWYVCNYYQEVLRHHPALLAHDRRELMAGIKTLLLKPRLLADNQARLCERFCYRIDGKSGERLFDAVMKFMRKSKI